MRFNKFNSEEYKWFSPFNVLIRASEEEAREIMEHFGYEILPDVYPDDLNKPLIYLFLYDTRTKLINPMWFYAYAFGGGYNDNPPVGEELNPITLKLDECKMQYYNAFDLIKIKENHYSDENLPDNVCKRKKELRANRNI